VSDDGIATALEAWGVVARAARRGGPGLEEED